MKYTVEIDIDQPIEKVVALFDNSDNLKEWMPGLQSFEHLSGEPGKKGAKSKMVFLHGKRRTEMVETVTANNLPQYFSGTYEANGVLNIQENEFVKLSEGTTRWVSHCEFQFNNFMMKIIGFLMPGAFKKQSTQFLVQFKAFAEKQP